MAYRRRRKSEWNGIITTSTLHGRKWDTSKEVVGTKGIETISSSLQISAATMAQSMRDAYHCPK